MTDITQTTIRPHKRFQIPLTYWCAVWRSRRALARLDPHLLRDIGVSDVAAKAEARRPVWDAPAPWRGGA